MDFKHGGSSCTVSPWRVLSRCLPVCHQRSTLMVSKFLGTQKLLVMNGSPPTEVDHQGKLCSWQGLINSLSFRADPEGSASLLARSGVAYTSMVSQPSNSFSSVNLPRVIPRKKPESSRIRLQGSVGEAAARLACACLVSSLNYGVHMDSAVCSVAAVI